MGTHCILVVFLLYIIIALSVKVKERPLVRINKLAALYFFCGQWRFVRTRWAVAFCTYKVAGCWYCCTTLDSYLRAVRILDECQKVFIFSSKEVCTKYPVRITTRNKDQKPSWNHGQGRDTYCCCIYCVAAVPDTERSSFLAYLKVHAVAFLVPGEEVVRCAMVALGGLDQAYKKRPSIAPKAFFTTSCSLRPLNISAVRAASTPTGHLQPRLGKAFKASITRCTMA